MIVREFYRTRKDGVNLYRTIDALTTDEGEVVLDENGNAVARGFYILQNETGIEYDEAIDVETAPYTYSETDKPIENYTEEDSTDAILPSL